jgi:hypothetical protein
MNRYYDKYYVHMTLDFLRDVRLCTSRSLEIGDVSTRWICTYGGADSRPSFCTIIEREGPGV